MIDNILNNQIQIEIHVALSIQEIQHPAGARASHQEENPGEVPHQVKTQVSACCCQKRTQASQIAWDWTKSDIKNNSGDQGSETDWVQVLNLR